MTDQNLKNVRIIAKCIDVFNDVEFVWYRVYRDLKKLLCLTKHNKKLFDKSLIGYIIHFSTIDSIYNYKYYTY